MRRALLYSAAVVLAVGVGLPGVWYLTAKPVAADQLDNTLKGMGFWPINPPSNLINLGSLYYVDSEVKFFRTICPADPADVAGAIAKSQGTRMVADELYSGSYNAGLKLNNISDYSAAADFKNKYLNRVRYSLSDVQLYEIALGANYRIFEKIMARAECSHAVADVFRTSGYVCQGQTVLEASVIYDLNIDEGKNAAIENAVETNLIKDTLKDVVKTAVQAQTKVDLVEKSGKLVSGSSLKYGVAMNPTCLAPQNARFARVLPTSRFGRFVNYVKFNILEPILPGT